MSQTKQTLTYEVIDPNTEDTLEALFRQIILEKMVSLHIGFPSDQ